MIKSYTQDDKRMCCRVNTPGVVVESGGGGASWAIIFSDLHLALVEWAADVNHTAEPRVVVVLVVVRWW